ncbi:hypothetical protein EfsSVR2281_42920 (plasmid) [Enterococcus faecalis]|nr:hypothetical protein EfsSVR2281_42920 [Enterococcus faecalis]
MSISEENKKKISELSGAQSPTPQTQKQLHSLLHRFKLSFSPTKLVGKYTN